MRKREAIQPRNLIERKSMCFLTPQTAMQPRHRKLLQVPSGSKSVVSIQGITRIPGRSGRFRRTTENQPRAVGSSKVLQAKREPKVCQKSDHLIVVEKRGNARGAKGMPDRPFPATKHAQHRRLAERGT